MIVAATAATAMLGVAAQPAAALNEYSVEATHTQAGGNAITQSATASVLRTNGNTVTLKLDCLARTSPPAVGTGIPQCYFVGTDGTRRDAGSHGALSGPVNHRGAIYDVPKQHYRVCVQSNALFHTGSGWFAAPRICSA